MMDLNSAPIFQGIVREDDVALEIVDHLERFREFAEAQTKMDKGDSDG